MDHYLAQSRARFVNFRQALSKESDRGCALYAAAYLDRALSDLLYMSLVENKNIQQDLFDGTAPLASFSSRITLAYYLGKLSPSIRRDLNLIRKIRNDFAHTADSLTFETKKIANRCKHLQYSYHEADHHPRDHFTAAVCGILATIEAASLLSIAPVERVDNIPSSVMKDEVRDLVKDQLKKVVSEDASMEE